MKITLINGEIHQDNDSFTPYAIGLAKVLGKRHWVDYFQLNKYQIYQCTGCWSCWWKTPGLCPLKDDAEAIMRSVIQSDLVIFASPIVAGFVTSLLKKFQDRLIVLIHPYIELVEGECHHRKRYDTYPDFALLLESEKDTDEEDIQIISDIHHRLALNFHGKLKKVWLKETINKEEVAHELNHF